MRGSRLATAESFKGGIVTMAGTSAGPSRSSPGSPAHDAYLAAIVQSSADAIIGLTPNGTIASWNTAAERLYGYSAEQAVGQPITILDGLERGMLDGPRDGLADGSVRTALGGRTVKLETVNVRRNGTRVEVGVTMSPIRDGSGAVIGVVCLVQDVHERKIAERELTRLADASEHGTDAVISIDRDGHVHHWNHGAERLYGFSAPEAIGRHMRELTMVNDEFRHDIAKVLAGEPAYQYEAARRREDGTMIEVLTTVVPWRVDGQVVGVTGVTIDITERKRAADALAEAEERFRGAFDQAPIGMALLDLDARFTKVNDAMCELTGYSSIQLQNATLETTLLALDAGAIVKALAALRHGEQTVYAGEKRFVHAHGHSVWVALQLTLIRDRDGRPLRFIAQAQDVTERKRYEQRLRDLADHDTLTGLLNRRSFTRELDAHAARVNRYGPEGALLIIDLDHFKYVNDTLGHHAGDEILRATAARFAHRLRSTDVLARFGGDEFAVLLPKADATTAHHVAFELQRALADQHPQLGAHGLRAATASIGIATFQPPLTGEEVLVNADLAMYDAKEAGRNRITLYDGDERSLGLMKGRVSSVQRIRAALANGQFEMLAQPIVDYRTGRTSQYELLLRMRDENGKLLAPAAFLSTAERLDLVQALDGWVIQHAIGLLAHDDPSIERLPVHINLSGRSIGDPALLELIERGLERTQVARDRLIFEITETAAVRHITQARRFSERLTQLGCGLALDDFGAGFGTFYYLKHLPFDFLKIDGEFVRNCRNDPTDRAVIEAAVGIARALGKKTIAEFVEDEQTAGLLTRLGVDYGQGYYHGRPA